MLKEFKERTWIGIANFKVNLVNILNSDHEGSNGKFIDKKEYIGEQSWVSTKKKKTNAGNDLSSVS